MQRILDHMKLLTYQFNY